MKQEAAAKAPKLSALLKSREDKRRQEALEQQQQQPEARAKSSKKHLRPAEKIADAKAKKDHGNTLFKENNVEDATKRYTQALTTCCEMDGTLNPTDQAEVNEIKMACYCNLVLCNIKLKLPKLAQHNAMKAVELDGNNAKAHFRRGQALMETKDYEDAKKELLAAQKLDPEDTLKVSTTLKKCEALMDAEKKKQQKAFGKMFASESK